MSVIKTILFWLFVVVAVSLGIYSYIQVKKNKKPKIDAVSFLPANCIVYLKTNDFFELNKKINSQSLIADKLKNFKEIAHLFSIFNDCDSLLSSDQLLTRQIEKNLIHFALYPEENWLLTFNLKELGDQDLVREAFSTRFKTTPIKNGDQILSLKGLQAHLHINEGVVMISNNDQFLSKVSTNAAASFITSEKYEKYKAGLTENNLLSVYIDQTGYSQSQAVKILNLASVFSNGFSSGSIEIEPSELKVNGFLSPDSTELLALLKKEEPAGIDELLPVLPYNTVFIEAFAFGSYKKFQSILNPTPKNNSNLFWQETNDRGLYNVQADFTDNIGNHLISFETLAGSPFIALPLLDTVKAGEHLVFMSDSVLQTNNGNVYRLHSPKNSKSQLSLFKQLGDIDLRFATIWNSHLYFSPSLESLSSLQLSMQKNALLSSNESFMAYKNQNIFEKFNYFVYTSPSQNKHKKGAFLNLRKMAETQPFENFRHFSFSVVAGKKDLKFRLHLLHETENMQKNMLWTFKLDTVSLMTAKPFVNHLTGENELCLQDEAKSLYLINAKGSLLWKKTLNEKIVSPIYPVDAYKNNKFQLLFSTKNYLHLIDRNGNYVSGFPVKLPAEAAAPLTVFDYEQTKDYRLFISCLNKKIYNFSIQGKVQEGFVPVKTENIVALPIQYMIVGQSHFLVALDVEGKIYAFSRKGALRLALRNRTVANCNAFYLDPSASLTNSYLFYVDDKNSLINKISFADVKGISKISEDLSNAHVSFNLIDENRSTDVLVTSNSVVSGYDFSGNPLVKATADNQLSSSLIYSDESKSLIFAYSKSAGLLYTFDLLNDQQKSKDATALPLISDLFKDNKKYLIVTSGAELNCSLMD